MKKTVIGLLLIGIHLIIYGETLTNKDIDVLFDAPPEISPVDSFSILTINTDSVYIREFPRLDSKILGKANFNDKLQVILHEIGTQTIDRYAGHWVRIKYGMRTGYVFSKF